MPCEPFFCWWGGHVRVAGSKIPRMVRHSGDGNKSARGHGKGRRHRRAYDDGYIIDVKMINSLRIGRGVKQPRERLRMDNCTLSALLSFLRYTYYRDMSDEGRVQGLVAGCDGWVAKCVCLCDVAVIIHYNSCNAGRDGSTINARREIQTSWREVLRALGYEMKRDDVTGTNRMDSRQKGRVAPCGGAKKPWML